MPARPSHVPHTRKVSNRFGGLDGLRAVAVGLVLVYHLFPGALPGGFLGVDVFFVISGFLITSLLLPELRSTGRIDLLGFWRRRARRLLPAIALVILVSTSLALAVSRDLLVGIGHQIMGAIFFVSNWVFITAGSDYFNRDSPELFRNFWSLALEEQFYIVLPLIAILLWRLRARASRAAILALLGVASASLMAYLSVNGAATTRIYFGSDSHSFGLLSGAAMAVMLERPRVGLQNLRSDKQMSDELGRFGQIITSVVAALGFTVLTVLAFTLAEGSPASFTGGFQLATLASLAVVWAVTRKGAWVGAALDVLPLRWIGERSYGLYLWHWPLLLIFTSVWPGSPWIPQAVTLAATFALTELSYRYVEQPVRKLGLRAAFRTYFHRSTHSSRQRIVSVSLTAVLALCLPTTVFAAAIAPERTSSEEAVLRGMQLLDGVASHTRVENETLALGAASSAPTHRLAQTHRGASGVIALLNTNTARSPDATSVIEGRDVTAIGDSVMLASYPELSATFGGIDVDAAVSRGMWSGVDILAALAESGKLRSAVVIGLGTNGAVDLEALNEIKQISGSRPVVFVNAHAERDWIQQVNADLVAFADAHRGVVVAHWDEDIASEPEALAGDGIHPGPRGGEIYAQAVRRALDELVTNPSESLGWGLPRR